MHTVALAGLEGNQRLLQVVTDLFIGQLAVELLLLGEALVQVFDSSLSCELQDGVIGTNAFLQVDIFARKSISQILNGTNTHIALTKCVNK